MEENTLEQVIKEYREAYDAIPQEALELDLRVTFKTIQALAKGNPVSSTQLSDIWGMPLDQVQVILKQAEENGRVEINDRGDLVGAVLSLNPTQHQILMDNQHLYSWCAYDAMYTPGIVGMPAQIVSEDPVTGGRIQVSITPHEVEMVQPESAVVSVVDPGGDMSAGPESTRCTHMLFFESRESAEQWKQDRTGISILTVEETFKLAKEFQIEPARRLRLV